MLVHCPSCSARHRLPESHQAGGTMTITCQSCGHRWTEHEIIEIEAAPASRSLPRVIDHGPSPEDEARRLAAIARESESRFREREVRRRRNLRNWLAYAAFFLAPIGCAALFPEAVVAAAPITAKAYERLGYAVNIYGLELRRIERQHAIVNGTRVLSIKGSILNVSEGERKLPRLRFALTDEAGKELYLDHGCRGRSR
ncbi:MAG: zinc-ribbon domain-containing protein [Hyphomicrobiales bacterium]